MTPRIVNFSGGRSSGFMVHLLLQNHGGELPPDHEVVFANTGMEREETLLFVQAVSDKWGVPITWLEYRYHPDRRGRRVGEMKNDVAVVDFETASRKGEPFEQLIRGHGYLPNVVSRFCTTELKVETTSRYAVRMRGLKAGRNRIQAKDGKPGRPRTPNEWINLIGFRRDEPRRVLKRINESDVEFPLYDAGITTAHVQKFWRAQNFDLGIPSWKGNCSLCFLKGKKNLVHTLRLEPGLARWWLDQEAFISEHKRIRMDSRTAYLAQFSKLHSIADLVDEARMPQLIPVEDIGDEPAWLSSEPQPSCYCGDDT